jgi:hypothetical protein
LQATTSSLIPSKEDFRMFRKSFFCFSRNSEVCSNWSGSFYAEREWFTRHFGCLKNAPHSYKGKIEGVSEKSLALQENLLSAQIGENAVVQIDGNSKTRNRKCSEYKKTSSYLQRKIWGGVSGKTFCVPLKSVLCPNRHERFCAGGREHTQQTIK